LSARAAGVAIHTSITTAELAGNTSFGGIHLSIPATTRARDMLFTKAFRAGYYSTPVAFNTG